MKADNPTLLSYVRKVETFLGIVALVAGVVFLVFPLAAIPDETLVGVGAAIAAIVWIVQELRSALDRLRGKQEQQSLVEHYEKELGALSSGAPERVREALETLRRKTRDALRSVRAR